MIEVYATERHYLDHLLPLAVALGADCGLLVGSAGLAAYAEHRGVHATVGHPHKPGPAILVASRKDAARVHADRGLALLEHGAGQTYRDEAGHPNYPGGSGWDRCALFLVPGPHAARAWRRARYDGRVVELAGSPRLDPFLCPPGGRWGLEREPVVAVSFHWDCRAVAPETRATWRWWLPALERLVGAGYELLGHAHPRAWRDLAPIYERLGIDATPVFGEVLERASLYVCDNSSTLYEFAATGRPVVCLNAPIYRRDVDHGLRFWDRIPGVDVWWDEPLEAGIDTGLADGPAQQVRRARAVEEVFGPPGLVDGHATARAVAALHETFG